ncbi:ABC transporter permease [Caproicibacter sp.]|uniref:ABC transporter permease n=1 Tax=Caproicibacter sp. TaxID=2814884 RepID=UPI003988DF35
MEEKNTLKSGFGSRILHWIQNYKQYIIQYFGLIFVIAVFLYLTDGNLFSARNLETLIRQLVVILTITLGMAFIYSHGGMDISVGAVVALSSLCATYVMNLTAGQVLPAILVSIAVSVTCYLLNIIVTNQFGLMSTISSLSVMFVARGIVTYVNSMSTDKIEVHNTAGLELFRSNTPFLIGTMAVLCIVMTVLFNLTKLGKQNRAIGDNPLSAMQSGVRVKKVKVEAYVLAGIMVGIAAVFSLSRTGSVSEKTGSGLEMDAIVALILGGMALNGGAKSRISSAIIGSFTYVLLNNGLVMAGVDTQVVSLIKGIIFLIVVFLTIRQPKSKKVLPR